MLWGSDQTEKSPGFAAHHLLPIAARCPLLQEVNLAGCEIGGMLPGVSMPEMVLLLESCQQLTAFQARGGAPTGYRLLSALAQLPRLTSLSLARTDVTDASLLALVVLAECTVRRSAQAVSFPALRQLSLAHCQQLEGPGVLALLAAVPSLTSLRVDGCTSRRR